MGYPIVVAVVAALFAAILLAQYRSRRRPYQLVWAFALTTGAVAALAFVLFLAEGRSPLFFRLYYIAGALLMAAYMGLGSVYLLAPRRAANVTGAVLVGLSLIGIVAIALTPVDGAVLRGPNVEAGTRAIGGIAVVFVVLLNTFGAVAVIGGAGLSAWRLWRRSGPGHLLAANLLIATGTILASLAGALARLTGNGSAFWLLLAAGFVVLFSGFLLTTRRPSHLRTAAGERQTVAGARPS